MITKSSQLQKILSPFRIGMVHANSLFEEKQIFLVNAACIFWAQGLLILIALGYFFDLNFFTPYSFVAFVSHFIILIIIFVLQFKGYLVIARTILIVSAYIHFAIFDYIVFPNYAVGFYYIVPMLLTQVLFQNFRIHLITLLFSLFLFFDGFFLLSLDKLQSLHFINYYLAIFLTINILIKTNREKEKKLENQKQELEELNRFQSKFFVNISHELRTPLTLIDGTAAQLVKSSPAQHEELIQNLVRQSNKMKQIVDDTLDVSKIKDDRLVLNIKHIDLVSILHRVYQAFMYSFQEKRIKLQLLIEPESCIILGDGIYLERAINNILLNSLKYTPSGEVSLSLLNDTDEQVKVKISDTGIGIASEEIENVFKHFYQGDNDINRSGGSGIGLSFSQNIVEQHHGKITIESVQGKGTSIYLLLPIVEVQKNDLALSNNLDLAPTEQTESVKGINVLVVDDHSEMRNYISSLLEDVQIMEAENGAEGLEILANDDIDYVITDYMMPVMDGYEFIKTMKERQFNHPVLMITARVDIEGKLDILRLGVDDYLTKPFHQDELIIRMNNALRNDRERTTYIANEKIENPQSEDPFLIGLKDFIEGNIADNNLTINELAEHFALSIRTLFRKVKSLSGMSPKDFLREVKMQKAKEWVETKKYTTVKELANALGFQSASYFSQLYTTRFGKRPFN